MADRAVARGSVGDGGMRSRDRLTTSSWRESSEVSMAGPAVFSVIVALTSRRGSIYLVMRREGMANLADVGFGLQQSDSIREVGGASVDDILIDRLDRFLPGGSFDDFDVLAR